jgi:hypothetical protein
VKNMSEAMTVNEVDELFDFAREYCEALARFRLGMEEGWLDAVDEIRWFNRLEIMQRNLEKLKSTSRLKLKPKIIHLEQCWGLREGSR